MTTPIAGSDPKLERVGGDEPRVARPSRPTSQPAEGRLAASLRELAAIADEEARRGAALRSTLTATVRANQALQRAAAIDRLLSDLVVRGGQLDEIAGTVAEFTGKPVSVHDAEHHRLVGAVPRSLSEEALPRLLDPARAAQPCVAEALAELDGGRCRVVGPLPAAGLPERHLVATVSVQHRRRGYVVVAERPGRFGRLDRHITRRAALAVALALAAERRVVEVECDARAALVGDLIRGDGDAASLAHRAHYLGIDLCAPHVVCLIAARGAGVRSPSDVRRRLADAAGDTTVLVGSGEEGVVAVLALCGDRGPVEALAGARVQLDAALGRRGEATGLLGAISRPCTGPGGYVSAYAEARQVLGCLLGFAARSGVRVLTADDLGPARLLLASSSPADADRFVEDTLGPLLCVEGGDRGLLVTLWLFLEHARNVRCAALALGVHENTVRYRLARIEALTGLAVCGDADHQLTAHLALLVLRLEGRLPDVQPVPATGGAGGTARR